MTEDRLRKVLELERSKRFSDRAVTAGLDSFLKNLTTHEGSQLSSDVFARIQALPVAGYRSLTPAKRREWLEGVLTSVRDGGSENREAGSEIREAGGGKREAGGGKRGRWPAAYMRPGPASPPWRKWRVA